MAKDAVRIQEEDFDVDEETRAARAASKTTGAVVTFLGTARDHSEGKDVKSIEFSQYAGMATKALKQLRNDALDKFDIIEVRIVHRVTVVNPGDQIVLIVVTSKHRGQAFEACRWIIDTLKETVPIWKKEITPDGHSWVTEHP